LGLHPDDPRWSSNDGDNEREHDNSGVGSRARRRAEADSSFAGAGLGRVLTSIAWMCGITGQGTNAVWSGYQCGLVRVPMRFEPLIINHTI
jgi:hypothetical protein